jgi:hypothetical protein
MAWLLDTNILSEGRKPRPEPRVTAFFETQPLNQLDISVVNIAEIRFGIELQQDPAQRAELNDWVTLTRRPAFTGRISASNGRHLAQMVAVDGRHDIAASLQPRMIKYIAMDHDLAKICIDAVGVAIALLGGARALVEYQKKVAQDRFQMLMKMQENFHSNEGFLRIRR